MLSATYFQTVKPSEKQQQLWCMCVLVGGNVEGKKQKSIYEYEKY